jgi:hypothetical protein
MSGADAVLIYNNIANRSARSSRTGSLRLILLHGEALRVPKRLGFLRVLSGTAWVSMDGKDFVVAEGQSLDLRGRGPALGRGLPAFLAERLPSKGSTPALGRGFTPALVSAVRCPAVVVEMR